MIPKLSERDLQQNIEKVKIYIEMEILWRLSKHFMI